MREEVKTKQKTPEVEILRKNSFWLVSKKAEDHGYFSLIKAGQKFSINPKE